jgi:predicted nicotinamide N-methyase
LTDLAVVIERVTGINVQLNTIAGGSAISNAIVRPRRINKGNGTVVAIPLCWGNEEDEVAVTALLESLATAAAPAKGKFRRKKKGSAPEPGTIAQEALSRQPGVPDLVLIGDVAYQHKPGAPSHFDILMSTLLKFVDDHTIVMFGTRIRMAASNDLLDIFLEHFDEIVTPALRANEIDAAFAGVKHNMTIHFLQRKKATAGAP